MIDMSVSNTVRAGVCAVGYIAVDLQTFTEDMRHPEKPPNFEIVGTAFLVRETTALRNRHVIEASDGAFSQSGLGSNNYHRLSYCRKTRRFTKQIGPRDRLGRGRAVESDHQ